MYAGKEAKASRELTVSLLEEWLTKYKFRNWTVTETNGHPVTDQMRSERAKKIAQDLNDSGRWHSHSRGISAEVLRRDLNLQIEDFGKNEDLNGAIRPYYKLLRHYMMASGYSAVLHRRGKYLPLG